MQESRIEHDGGTVEVHGWNRILQSRFLQDESVLIQKESIRSAGDAVARGLRSSVEALVLKWKRS